MKLNEQMLNENALTAFLKLAETGSFQDAARAIGVSNASLSRYIAQAEEHVGFALFHRTRSNSTLTRDGQEFLPVAIGLRADLERYARQVESLQQKGRTTLLIGCGPLTTRAVVLPLIEQVMRDMPDLRFKVIVSADGAPLELLQSGQIDVFIGDLTYTPNADDVEIFVMEKRPVVFVAHAAHPIHAVGPCSLRQIFEYPFASPHLHKHWKATLIKALGDNAQAIAKVNTLPQIESDDFALLTGLLDRPEFIVGGMHDTFSERLSAQAVKEIAVQRPISWNICAARKMTNSSAALDLFWARLIEGDTNP